MGWRSKKSRSRNVRVRRKLLASSRGARLYENARYRGLSPRRCLHHFICRKYPISDNFELVDANKLEIHAEFFVIVDNCKLEPQLPTYMLFDLIGCGEIGIRKNIHSNSGAD